MFSIDIQDDIITVLLGGVIGLIGLFLLVAMLLKMLLEYEGWVAGFTILASPFILIFLGILIFLSLLKTPRWRDETIYKSGSEYLILQLRDNTASDYRVFVTSNPDAKFRGIRNLDKAIHDESIFYGDEVTYLGKKWHKQSGTKR